MKIDTDLRLDVFVEELISVELKAQEGFIPVHDAILLSYMRMLESPKGILINFHCTHIMSMGQKTFVNGYFADLPNE